MNTNTAEELEDYGPWKFSEAPEEVKQAAIGKNRDINTDHEWWDYTYGTFKKDMAEKGIDVDDIYFSGFYSQGDGACFEGSISDLDKFLDAHFDADKWPTLRLLEKVGGTVSFSVRHTGHYYHAYSTSSSFEAEDWENCQPYDEEDLRYMALQALMEDFDQECEDFEEAALEVFRDHMKQLYKNLEAENDYLTSDDAIAETMEANDYTIDGEIT